MFNSNSKETRNRAADSGAATINIVGVGTIINGDITSNGDIRIDGTVTGKVVSKAKVVIGASCVIDGDIEAQNADISGRVNGKLTVSETLFLKPSAYINGDIMVNKLVVESGAEFNGKCSMLSSQRVQNSENSQQNGRTAPKTIEAEAN